MRSEWRWLYPRSELELPRRPAFCRPASGKVLDYYLNHTDVVLLVAHRQLRTLYISEFGTHRQGGGVANRYQCGGPWSCTFFMSG